jgi:putative DNA primase/helicase
MMMDKNSVSIGIKHFLDTLWLPGEVRELRSPKYNKYGHTLSGYFDSPEALIEAAFDYDSKANLYITLNPVNPTLMARAYNRVNERAEHTTADTDILRRCWFYLDIDPVRPSGISSSETEREAALATLNLVTDYLSIAGWPAPITAMSGNGYVALYRIDLSNNTEAAALLKSVLESLASRFNTSAVSVDPVVYNASRTIALIGTTKVKGDDLSDRPHRRSCLLWIPPKISVVRVEQLQTMVKLGTEKFASSGNSNIRIGENLRHILDTHGIEYKVQPPDAQGVTWYHVRRCPFHDDGPDFECGVGQRLLDGLFAGHCFHPEGAGKGWQDWKAVLGLRFSNPAVVPETPNVTAPEESPKFPITDTGNAELMVSLFGDRLRYDHKRSRWLIWNGNIWKPDTDGEVVRMATESARERYRRATTIQDLKVRERTASWAISSENKNRLEAAIILSQNILPVADSGENWDADPWLLGCNNGILDLKTGQRRQGKQTDRITMLIAADHDPGEDCPVWRKHIDQVMGGDLEKITYLQRVFGYALTGDTSEDCLFFFYGQTRTGKSVTLGTIQDLLGDYAKETASETFFIKKYPGSNDDIARLAGSRLVAAIEDEHQEKLAAGLVKHLTGRDKITGRFLYKERFEFRPTFKIFLAANDKPLIRGEDSGIWERLKCVPFEQFIAREQRVKNLRDQLQKEWPGILNWCIQGCLDWQREHNLNEPKAVTEATDLYRREMDKLADFIDARCNVVKGESVTIAAMYEAYVEWARDLEIEPLSKSTFGDKVKDRNFTKKRTGHKGEWRWVGIGLRPNADNADNADSVSVNSLREEFTREIDGKADSNDSMSANESKIGSLFVCGADNADKQDGYSVQT